MDDEPKVVPFKELKKKKLHLSDNLISSYTEGQALIKMKRKRKNDPRFDPRVHGVCDMKDWDFLSEEKASVRSKLEKMLKSTENSESRAKMKYALHLLKQREATYKDISLRRQTMRKLQETQIDQLKSGKSIKFLKRAELREQIRQKRIDMMSKKQRQKYLERQIRKNKNPTTDL